VSMSAARIRAVVIKELAEFRRNRFIVATASILPIVFLISPTASILSLKAAVASTALQKHVNASMFLPLLVPVFIPATMSAFSVVGEREQGTLEPVLTTPIKTTELLIGKAVAIFFPAVVLGYAMFGIYLAIVQIWAAAPVASAVLNSPQLPATLLFIPLLAAWAIWVGLAISSLASETRVAQQLSVLASLPAVGLAALMSFQVFSATFAVAAALAGALLVVDCGAWFVVARMFNRERLITGGGRQSATAGGT